MAIEQTALAHEINAILNGPMTFNARVWTAHIHLMDANITLIPVRVTYVNTARDYVNNFSDEVMMECVLPIGTYSDLFYPNKLNVEVTLTATPMNFIRGGPPKSFRYKATVVDEGQPRISKPSSQGSSTQALDLTDLVKVTFQLLPKVIYELRTASVGTIFRQAKPEDALKTMLTSETQKLKGDETERITGVDMVKADNQETKEQMVIPHGTMLYDLPDYFQKMVCGIYNNGISHFVQWNNWFVYPTFDIERFGQTDKVITIVVIPENKYPAIEKTYRKTGEHAYTILATSKGSYSNPVKEMTMNEGTGLRYMNAETVLSWDETKPENNKVNIQKSKIVSQITDLTPTDGVTFAPMSDTPITSNNFEERSKLAGRRGAYVSFLWENSYPEAITPGTMIRVLYLAANNQVNEIKGVIMKVEHFEHLTRKTLVEDSYRTNTAIFAYCENDLVMGTQQPNVRSNNAVIQTGNPVYPFQRY